MFMRPKLIPTLFTIPVFIALIALGSWQIQRLYWKAELIEKLQERSVEAPISLPHWLEDVDGYEFRRVAVSGEFLHEHEFYLINRSLRGKPGLNIVTVLKRSDGGGHVLVNRGWVSFDQRHPKTRPKSQPKGIVIVEGIVRLAKGPGHFMPDNDPHNNTWFYVDPPSMMASADLPQLQPYYILAANKTDGGLPVGHQWRIDIPNNHLQYAITWFALAFGLLVVYLLYHRRPTDSSDEI